MESTASDHCLNYGLQHTDLDGVSALIELALDLRSAWNHGADNLWRQLDPDLWESTQNPWVVLQTVSRDKLKLLLGDPMFRGEVDGLIEARRKLAEEPAWFQQTYPQSPLSCVAYFSMEFMLSEALPIYSGGLGNVAGDQLKAASDLGVPVIGVGLLYQQGYFRQVISPTGMQQAVYPYNDPGQLPITPVRQANGEWLRLKMDLPGHTIWLRTWQAQVGRAKLYLLDTNDAANYPPYRGITGELYGGGPDSRLLQELVLGIGGWRLLTALNIRPDVCHLNEGHAALAVLERARSFMNESGQSFDVALAVTRAGNLFTTHTAVEAGFDRFEPAQIEHCLGSYAEQQLGITLKELLALGRLDPEDDTEKFNMAYLAIRGCGAVNGVSRLHGAVSRRLFSPLFARWPVAEVPVSHVTNGVHTPTWDSAEADALWTQASGQDRWLGETDSLRQQISSVSDTELWKFRSAVSAALVEYLRGRLAQQLAAAGAPSDAVARTHGLLDPNMLTLAFARRFATYKRSNLLLTDPERLTQLLNHPERPMQLIMAGKAHPADKAGQDLIRRWVEFARRPEVRDRVIFLSDYDMHLAEHLVQGADVWLNTPRRPWEASGTSGMKVLVNGGLNLSILDGWWAEAYTPEVGWALGDGQEHGEDPAWDAMEARQLYDLLEREVAPEFYQRDEQGIPTAWVARMRHSMAQLTPVFSTNRVVREYTEQHYLPAAKAFQERAANAAALGVAIVEWRAKLEQHWHTLRLGEVNIHTDNQSQVFGVTVYPGQIKLENIRIELYADAVENGLPVREQMLSEGDTGETGGRLYRATVSAERAGSDYSIRLIPNYPGVLVPLEVDHITWQEK